MAYYMPQDIFNCAVLALALGHFVCEEKPEARSMIDEGLALYLDFYTEDDFLPDAEDCASRTLAWLRDQTANDRDMTFTWLAALNDAVLKYEPSGQRKPQRLFNGLALTSPRQPIPDRPIQYFKDLGLHFMNIQFGKGPPAKTHASEHQSGFGGLLQELGECLSQYISIHDKVLAVNLRHIIPIPFIYKPINYKQVAEIFQVNSNKLTIIAISLTAINPADVDIPLTYIKNLRAAVQKLRTICLGGADIVDGKPYKRRDLNSDFDEYDKLIEAYSSMGNVMNSWMRSAAGLLG